MKLIFALVGQRGRSDLFEPAIRSYLSRLAGYLTVENRVVADEQALFELAKRLSARTTAWLVLLDSRGKAFSSEDLAVWLGSRRDSGQQTLIFAIGPANGWSETAHSQAQTLLSLGPMTLPHELARVVLLEQIYRAFTILTGHPYHTGH